MIGRRKGFGFWWLLPATAGCVILAYGTYDFVASSGKNLRIGSKPYSLHKKTVALVNEGYGLSVEGRLEEAEKKYLAALTNEPTSVAARKSLALLYVEMNRREDAFKTFRELYRLYDKDTNVLSNYEYAKLCAERGMNGEEQKHYLRILSQQGFVENLAIKRESNGTLDNTSMLLVHIMAGDAYKARNLNEKDRGSAQEEYQTALALNPSTTNLRWILVWRTPKSDSLRLMRQIVAKNDDPKLTRECKGLISQWAAQSNGGKTERPSKIVSVPLSEEKRKFFEQQLNNQRLRKEHNRSGPSR